MKHSRVFIGSLIMLPSLALAQSQACTGVSGADCSPANAFPAYIPDFANIFVSTAAGVSVLFVIYGGMRLIVNFGDESAISQGKNSIIYALIGFAVSLAAQTIVSIVVTGSGAAASSGLPPQIAIMNQVAGFMLTVFNIVFVGIAVYAGIMLVLKHGSGDQLSRTKTTLMWAIIGALVVNAAAAIVNAVLNLGL